jgi:DUF971 family protein
MTALATSSIVNAPRATPETITLSPDGKDLQITRGTGAPVRLTADTLRAACRCAHCRRAQIDGLLAAGCDPVTILRVSPIGHYAVNIAFSDGHERGIFPWSYLAELATRGRCSSGSTRLLP